jgi:hypothetical protein
VMGAVFLSVASSIMAWTLLPRSRDGHRLGGVSDGVTGGAGYCRSDTTGKTIARFNGLPNAAPGTLHGAWLR